MASQGEPKGPSSGSAEDPSSSSAVGGKSTEQEPIPESDIPKYESLLQTGKEKLSALKEWKEKMLSENPPTQEFEEELGKTLGFTSAAFNIFRDDDQFFRLADELAENIVEMRNHFGDQIMPLTKHHMFGRGTFEVLGKTLVSGQYYEPIPFYGPPRKPGADPLEILKFYFWQFIDKPKKDIVPGTPVNCIYYLEKGIAGISDQPYWVLGMSAPGMHATVQTFIGDQPSFFDLEWAIVKRVHDKQQGNNPGFAAASYRGR